MVVFRLAIADLKKKKNFVATLLFLSILTSTFFCMGFSLLTEFKTAYPEFAKRQQVPDFVWFSEYGEYETKYETFLKQDSRVSFVEKEDIVFMESTTNNVNGQASGAVFFQRETIRKIEPLKIIKEDASISKEDAIYLPLAMEGNGIKTGDEFVLNYRNTDHKFQVAGFFETSYLGIATNAFMKYYVCQERFLQLYEETGAGVVLSARLKETPDRIQVSEELKEEFVEDTDFLAQKEGIMSFASSFSYSDIESGTMQLYSVPTAILIFMALLIGIISFIIVYIKAKESIEQNLVNIGSMQAMGYTTWQILLSHILKFTIIGCGGGIVGIFVSYLFLPFTSIYGVRITGIMLNTKIQLVSIALALVFVVGILLFATLSGGQKIRKITPITALRKGIHNHHFGKELFPLYKGKSGIYMQLSLKTMMANLRQNIAAMFIIVLSVFAVCIVLLLYITFGYDSRAITKMTGIEVVDVQIKPYSHVNSKQFMKELEKMEEVRKLNQTEVYLLNVEDKNVCFVISDDFQKTECITVGKGEMPKYDNEVVLTAAYLKKIGKKIGDTVDITKKGITKSYYITGSSTGTNEGGKMGLMNLEGMHRLDPYFTLSSIDVYLKEPENTKVFMDKLYDTYHMPDSYPEENAALTVAKKHAGEQIQRLMEQYGISSVSYAVMKDGETILSGDSSQFKIKEMQSFTQYLEGQLKSYAFMMKGIVGMVSLVMLTIMGTILWLTIKSMIVRQREEFGIYKALGYTTRELVKIIRLNFLVIAALGAGIGVLLCRLGGSYLLQTAIFEPMGMSIDELVIHPIWYVGIWIITVLYVYVLATMKSYQVKHITVCELLTE